MKLKLSVLALSLIELGLINCSFDSRSEFPSSSSSSTLRRRRNASRGEEGKNDDYLAEMAIMSNDLETMRLLEHESSTQPIALNHDEKVDDGNNSEIADAGNEIKTSEVSQLQVAERPVHNSSAQTERNAFDAIASSMYRGVGSAVRTFSSMFASDQGAGHGSQSTIIVPRTPISSGSGHSLSGGNVGTVGNLNLDFIASPSNFAAEEASLAENKDKIEMKLIDELLEKRKSLLQDKTPEKVEDVDDDNASYCSRFSLDSIDAKTGKGKFRVNGSDSDVEVKVFDDKSDDSSSEEEIVDDLEYSSELEFEVTPYNSNSDPFGESGPVSHPLSAPIEGQLDESDLETLKNDFRENKEKMLKMNALAYVDVFGALMKRGKNRGGDHHVSHPLSFFFKPADQAASANCAVYPVLGAMRYHLNSKISLKKNFKFNPWHLNFYDLLEKSNAFLEIFFRNIHLPLDSPVLIALLEEGITQSSDWHSTVRLIEKYGIAPAFPHVKRVNNESPYMTINTLKSTLRAAVKRSHDYYHSGKDNPESSLTQVKLFKKTVLKSIYTILGTSFGVPLEDFEWNLTTRDGKSITKKFPEGPKEFYETVVGREFGDQVAICNYPHLEMNRHYGIRVDHRIIDQPYRKFINLPIAKLTQYALEIVLSDRPLPITALLEALDYDRNGTLDESRFDYKSVFGLKNYFMSKENIFATRNYNALHAFLIVGVNLDSEKRPTQWLVESSWGNDIRRNGNPMNHLLMSHEWFCKYVFEIVVPRDMLHEEDKILANGASHNYDHESKMI